MDVEVTEEDIKFALNGDYKEFIEVMTIVNDMIDNPDKYTGYRALKTAMILASWRAKIAMKAAYLKTAGESVANRKKKNILISLEHALEEPINTLKLLGKVDARLSGLT